MQLMVGEIMTHPHQPPAITSATSTQSSVLVLYRAVGGKVRRSSNLCSFTSDVPHSKNCTENEEFCRHVFIELRLFSKGIHSLEKPHILFSEFLCEFFLLVLVSRHCLCTQRLVWGHLPKAACESDQIG